MFTFLLQIKHKTLTQKIPLISIIYIRNTPRKGVGPVWYKQLENLYGSIIWVKWLLKHTYLLETAFILICELHIIPSTTTKIHTENIGWLRTWNLLIQQDAWSACALIRWSMKLQRVSWNLSIDIQVDELKLRIRWLGGWTECDRHSFLRFLKSIWSYDTFVDEKLSCVCVNANVTALQ